ncbi:DUF480 domain-containing protein [Tessaracoccus defluvii]|uniref:DUF480 domain-containing protein n=2 Tax=Tessaracoccus defluvii TaxID=1285901 RepID=A0A7H0HAN0_9ACTN|nr:DUF480 domain-containing protein [Tessaracoccus defluvii]
MEKEVTVPNSYPLSLNALRTACNQTSSREPVVDYDERTIQDAVRSLKDKQLALVTWSDSGRRTLKYRQTIIPIMALDDDERAVLTVLLLRGPQAAGELKTRTDRLFAFKDRDDVEAVLRRLAAREVPLVAEIGRRPGQQDVRWAHLFGDLPLPVGQAPEPDREQILVDGVDERDAQVLATYDAVAAAYHETFAYRLDERPLERWLLDRVVELADDRPVADVGTGTGVVAAYLARHGADVTGFDFSRTMIDVATLMHPEVTFELGDLRRMMRPPAARGWGAITAWYTLVHYSPQEMAAQIGYLANLLDDEGILALATDAGAAAGPQHGWLGHDGPTPWVAHSPAQVRQAVTAAGLVEVETYVEIGDDKDRLYILAQRP